MSEPKLENPHYIDLEKTQVGVTLVYENGVKQSAVFKVPTNGEKGLNKFWDRILEEFDEKAMRKARNDLELRRIEEQNFRNKKHKAALESAKLRTLFDKKIQAFEMPFVKNATNEEKAAVRRSPNELILNIIMTSLAIKYINSNNISLIDFIDQFDEIEEKNK
jgi:hypothetical protein